MDDLEYVDKLLHIAQHNPDRAERKLAADEAARVMDRMRTRGAPRAVDAMRSNLQAKVRRPVANMKVRKLPNGWTEYTYDDRGGPRVVR